MRKLDNFERLSILLSASPLLKSADYYVDAEKVAKWVYQGHEWAISWEYDFFDPEYHPLDNVVEEVTEIFGMYRHIQNSVENAGDLSNHHNITFKGFDGNNDYHFGVARILVDDLERFTEVKNATSNSHSSGSISTYRKLLKKYKTVIEEVDIQSRYEPLNYDQLKKILE